MEHEIIQETRTIRWNEERKNCLHLRVHIYNTAKNTSKTKNKKATKKLSDKLLQNIRSGKQIPL